MASHLRQVDQTKLRDEQRVQIHALVADFPKLWSDPKTSNRQRKRLVRLRIEDVTLSKGDKLTAQILFKGGRTQTLTLVSFSRRDELEHDQLFKELIRAFLEEFVEVFYPDVAQRLDITSKCKRSEGPISRPVCFMFQYHSMIWLRYRLPILPFPVFQIFQLWSSVTISRVSY